MNWAFVGIIFTVFASIALPLAALILLRMKYKTGLLAAFIGAVGFFVFALVLESILHIFVIPIVSKIPWAYVAYGCFASGLFEETARLIGFKLLNKANKHSLSDAFAYGIGHGGIEAILIVGISYVGLAATVFVPGGELSLASTPTHLLFIAGLERILAMLIHISLSLLLWLCVTKKQGLWLYFAAIALHMLANFGAAMAQAGLVSNIAAIYISMLLAGIIAITIFVSKYKRLRHVGKA